MSSLAVHYASAAKKRAQRLNFSDSAVWRYPASSASRGVLLFVHGFRGNHHGLEAIAGALPDYEIFIPDLPGFGASEPLANSNLESYGNWLKLLLQQMPDQTHLVSHSFGTQVATTALAQGATAASLTMINPIIRKASEQKDLATRAANKFYKIAESMDEPRAKELLSSTKVTKLMSSKLAKTKTRDLRDWIHQQHLEHFSDFHSAKVAIEGFKAASNHSVLENLPNLDLPTLVIGGAKDELAPKSELTAFSSQLQKQLHRFRYLLIDEVGHLIHYEKPDTAAREIESFLGDHF